MVPRGEESRLKTRDFARCAVSALTLFALLNLAGAQAHAQISDGIVKIGVLNDEAGPYAALAGPGSRVAALMAVEDFGAADKGTRVEVVFADHQNKVDVGARIATQWYDAERVDVIVDVPTSPVALAINQIAREKGKALLVSSGATSDLTGKACSTNTIHWTYDNWALANSTGKTLVKSGARTWFFLTVDDAFGHGLERAVERVVQENGGTVLGKIRHPLSTSDFSSFLLQAQASQASIIGLASAGTNATNAIEQGTRLGIVQHGQHLAPLLTWLTDVHRLGLNKAQGLMLSESFYWDLNDQTRAWSIRFARRHWGAMPTMAQAGVYSAVLHYLKAVEALKSDDGTRVIAKMKALPTDDPLFGKGTIRQDGRKIHPMYLFEVKKPSESNGPWDLYKLRATIPAAEAFRPLDQGDCPLVKK
ncbi:MAG TPA: ABC transporter substrate-binding protein [Candidatus Eisenbacteria bacterium]|nr:ABC transporter substrate-binding protein [Candidatus Eisenbacteria bacterium]